MTYVAFVLRFHPLIQWLKINLDKKQVTEVQAYCGSYLPGWRPGRDYRMTYSAQKELGGGVHLDLIHEIDYLRWLLGDPASYNTFLSRKSALEINSIDSAHYYLTYDNMNISLTLNYFRKDAKRVIEIVMNDETVTADLLAYKITSSTGVILFECKPNNIKMYEDQMRYFINCIRNNEKPENNIEYSLKTLEIALGK
jgi:predicted dehydrogenase